MSKEKQAINEAFDLITEYSQTRSKIKKQLGIQQSQEEVTPQTTGNCTARVDSKLIDKLYTITGQIEELVSPFSIEFEFIIKIIKQMNIRRRKKKFRSLKSQVKSSQLQNVSFNDSECNISGHLLSKK